MEPITRLSQLDFNKSYTYADYLTWKFEEFVELVKGKLLRPMAGPSSLHQQYATNLVGEIYLLLKKSPCKVYAAPFDVRLTRGAMSGDAQVTTVVQPDICVVCDKAKIDRRGCLGAPDWIIEILSPGNVLHDTKTKFDLYEENGVREYWIVYPGEKTVLVYVLDAHGRYQPVGEYAEPGPVPATAVPGLVLEWADVFDDL